MAGPSETMQGYPEQVQHLIADAPGDAGRTRKLHHAQPDEEQEGSGRSGKKARLEVGRNLFGALHVSGVKVVAPTGELGLWFLFTVSVPLCGGNIRLTVQDLCVGTEGKYVHSLHGARSSLIPSAIACAFVSLTCLSSNPRCRPSRISPIARARYSRCGHQRRKSRQKSSLHYHCTADRTASQAYRSRLS
jgi:hypothetical protein